MRSRRGLASSARPMATRCFSPPDRLRGRRSSRWSRSSNATTASKSRERSAARRKKRPYRRFARTSRWGRRRPSWNT